MENHPGPDNDIISVLTVQNNTPFALTIKFLGPEHKSLELHHGDSAQVILQKGTYAIAAEARAGIRPYTGREIFSNEEYDVDFLLDNNEKALCMMLS
jgi:hypothetical protein